MTIKGRAGFYDSILQLEQTKFKFFLDFPGQYLKFSIFPENTKDEFSRANMLDFQPNKEIF